MYTDANGVPGRQIDRRTPVLAMGHWRNRRALEDSIALQRRAVKSLETALETNGEKRIAAISAALTVVHAALDVLVNARQGKYKQKRVGK